MAEVSIKPVVQAYFDEATFTVSYVVSEPEGNHCAIIDSVLDYNPSSGRTGTGSADKIISYVRENNLIVDWILETHVHADHLTAAPYLQQELGGKTAVGDHVNIVQGTFKTVFNTEPEFATDGRQFDKLFGDGESFNIGNMNAGILHTPGHTPACITYLVGDTAFVGDTLFMPDYGTARCDFPGGDASALYRSIQRIFELPDDTRMFMCHDYPPEQRGPEWVTSVGAQKTNNIHLPAGTSEDDFVKLRNARDAEMAMPVLILPSVQVNMRAGQMPPPDDNGVTYLKIPVNLIGKE